MSNSTNMTLEEKIVQKLKDETLFQLIGDEDAITDLVGRAIREALFKDHVDRSGYNSVTTPSPVMAAARKVAEQAAKEMIEKEVALLLEDEKLRGALLQAFIAAIPSAMENVMRNSFRQIADTANIDAQNNLLNMLRSKGIAV